MPAFLIPLLLKIGPYLAGLVALVATYFGIKRKGAAEEREKLKAQTEKAVMAAKQKVEAAVQKDKVIDKTVGEQIEKIREQVQAEPAKTPDEYKPGDRFKF